MEPTMDPAASPDTTATSKWAHLMELTHQPGALRRGTLAGSWRNFVAEMRGAYQSERRASRVEFYRTEIRGRPFLKIIGWRWIDRGPVYWMPRLSWSFVQFLLAAMLSLMAIETTALILMSRHPLFLTVPLMVIWWLSAVPAFIYPWRRLQVFGFRRGRVRGQSPWMGPVFVVLLPVLAGMMVAMFLSTVRRDFPGESAAREAYRSVQDDLRGH